MTIGDAIKNMREHGLKVMAYDGDNASVVRDYMEKAMGMEMLEFDAIIFGSKGQVWGGECNRTVCSRLGAFFYNNQTFGYYCGIDARAINSSNGLPICTEVDHQLNREEQDNAYRTFSATNYG